MVTKQVDVNEIRNGLNQFYGTQEYHRWNVLYRNLLLTDGAKYVADSCGAYWLMDVIGSYQKELIRKGQTFQVWKLRFDKKTVHGLKGNFDAEIGVVTCEDGNYKLLYNQVIEYTDFPLPEGITLWVEYSGNIGVILLPGEH